MTLARKIAALLIALEGGYELKLKGGHTIVWEEEGPGFLMHNQTTNQDHVMMIGDEGVYGFIVAEAKRMTADDIKAIEDKFRQEAASDSASRNPL